MPATYREIKADILHQIADGTWQPGALLPRELELAESYDCARATVNRALRELAEEGIVERKRRAGTRVRQAPVREARFGIPLVRDEIEERGARYRYALLSRDETQAPDWLRGRLNLAQQAPVLHLVAVHFSDDAPYQYEDRWISLDALPQARQVDFTQIGPNEWLVNTVPFSQAEIGFSATRADETLSAQLGCSTGDALFQAERSTWWKGDALTYVRLVFRAGHRMTARY